MQRRETFLVLSIWGSRVGEEEFEEIDGSGLCSVGEGSAACCVFDVYFEAEAEEVGNCGYVAKLGCAKEDRLIGGIGGINAVIGWGLEQELIYIRDAFCRVLLINRCSH